MSDLHNLILVHGHATARAMVPSDERHLVDAAAAILEVEREEIGKALLRNRHGRVGFCNIFSL